jgi:hypothetical protein
MFQGSMQHYALQDREVCGSCGSCFRSEVMRHCTPADQVLAAVLEGGVGATVAGAAAISVAAILAS